MECYYKEFIEKDIFAACELAVSQFGHPDTVKMDGSLIKEFRRLSSLINIFKVTTGDTALSVKLGCILESIEKVVKKIKDGYKTIQAYRALDELALDCKSLTDSKKFIL